MAAPNPVLVEVIRGENVESQHRGAVCVADASGQVVHAWGDVDAAMCPRSAIKPFQAMPLLETGAAEAFELTDTEIAMACASHSGEPAHVIVVAAWLKRVGLAVADLECGVHPPVNIAAHDALIRAGEAQTALHNNCSGKHAGFLTTARHLGVATRGYTAAAHPVQRLVLDALGCMAGMDALRAPIVRDGCSAPNIFMPLKNLAVAWARLGSEQVHGARWDAGRRIVAAMKSHPYHVCGSDRPGARLITALDGSGIAKVGAEGVYAAVLPERGLGVAVKIDDGAARAAAVAIAAVLDKLGAFRADARPLLADILQTPISAWAGFKTGVIRPASGWLT